MAKRKTKTRKPVRTKPIKIAALVIAAIQNIRETKGSTSDKIVDYITLASDLPQGRIKPQVQAALKKGIEYGVIRRFRGQYFLPIEDELDRADRIAARFAKIPTPLPSDRGRRKLRSDSTFARRKILKTQPAMNVARKSLTNDKKRLIKSRSMPLSLTSTPTEKSYYLQKSNSPSGSDAN